MAQYQAGVIAATSANFGFRDLDKWIEPYHLFPGLGEPEDDPEQMSDESILHFFQVLAAAQTKKDG